MSADLEAICLNFRIPGRLSAVTPYGGGHINDTFLSHYDTSQGTARFIHQRINHNVFREPEKVMANIERVTRFARQQVIAAGGAPDRETLNLVPALDGRSFFRTADGSYWRTYRFIEGARTYEVTDDLRIVRSAANAFGRFQNLLNSLPGERLHETIPNFHHTRKRFEDFTRALEADPANRAKDVKPEIAFVLKREPDASIVVDLLASGALPERVTHNDTKLNNVLIDDATGQGLCVIDLDTMMPGSALYDFGDLVRMGASTAAEDEPNLDKVDVDLSLFEQLARGYTDAARSFLEPLEWQHLVFSGRLITYEQSIRFLGDYLNGDTYYKVHRPGQNLDRARTQIKLVEAMERKQEAMEQIVERCREG